MSISDTVRFAVLTKYFLQIHLIEDVITELADYYVDMKNIGLQHIVAYRSNKCNTVKCAYQTNANSKLCGNLEMSLGKKKKKKDYLFALHRPCLSLFFDSHLNFFCFFNFMTKRAVFSHQNLMIAVIVFFWILPFFGLLLSICTERCHKNNISESQNGPLKCTVLIIMCIRCM